MKKASFLSKPNIKISQTADELDLTFGQLGRGKPSEPGQRSGPGQHGGRKHRHRLPGRGLGQDAWLESPTGSEQHPQEGASKHQSGSSKELIDQYIQEHERQISFPDPPCPSLPDTPSPNNIQPNVPQVSKSSLTAFDPALGGTRASGHGPRNAGATTSRVISGERVPEATSPNVHTKASQAVKDASQPPPGVTAYSLHTQGGVSKPFGPGQLDSNTGAVQSDNHIESSSAAVNLPPALPPPSLQHFNNLSGIADSSGIRTIRGDDSTVMQSSGIYGASTLGMHPLPGLLPIGFSPPGVPPPNSNCVNGQYGLSMNPYPGNVLSPHSVPIYQQSRQDGSAPRVHLPQSGYQTGSLPPFGAPQIAPTVNTSSYISSQPQSQRYGTALEYPKPAASSSQTPGSANVAANGQPPPLASFALHAAAESAPPPAPALASKSTDSVIQILAERAVTDPDLEVLMHIVGNEEATPEEMEKFQALMDELTQMPKAHQAGAQALQPPTRSSPSSAVVPVPVNGHKTARPAPAPTPTPTPAKATLAPTSPAARLEPPLQPQRQALRSKVASDFSQADVDLQGSVFRAKSQMQSGVSGEKEGCNASGGVKPVVLLRFNQHMAPAGANQSNEEEPKNWMERHTKEICVPLLKPPSPNENSATPNLVTQKATSDLRSLGDSEVPPQATEESVVHSQTDPHQTSQDYTIRTPASSALAAQSTWGNKEKSRLAVERPLTNAELLARKLAKAEIAEEDGSKTDDAMLQAPMPPSSDATQWPSLGESRLMGGKGKTKKGTKEGPKLGNKPGPKLDQRPDLGSSSGPALTNFSARLYTLDNIYWNTVQGLQQMKNEFKNDIASRPEQDANAKDNSYFASNGSAPLAKEKDSLAKLFEKYRDPTDEEDKTGVNGTMRYFQDLGLNLESAEIFVPLEIVQAPQLAELSKDGFVDAWKTIGADTIAKQRVYVAGQLKQLSVDMALFKRVYRHTFVCSRESGQKALPLDNALIYWEMIFNSPGKPWVTGGSATTNWLNLWIEFLKANWTKTVNKDMWNQTFEFFQKTMQDDTLSFWSEDGAWPGVIDDFVAYVKEKRGDLPDIMETD